MKTKFTFLFSSLIILLFSFHSTAQTWQPQAVGLLPENYGVFSISVVSEDVVWAVAFDQMLGNGISPNHLIRVLKTTDGGENWQVSEIKEAIGRISFHIVAMDSNTAFITTNDYDNGSGRGLFKTTDGGASWTEIYSNVAAGVWVHFFDDQEGIVINRRNMAKTMDGGATWSSISTANIPAFDFDEFTALASGNNSLEVIGDNIWFGTTHERIFHSKDRGQTWGATKIDMGDNALLLSLAFKDELNGITFDINSVFFNSNNTTQFGVTQDGGETWELFTSNHQGYVSDITYVPGTEATLIATSDQFINDNYTVSILSRDFGRTWETLNQYIPMVATDFISPTIGWSGHNIIIDYPKEECMYKWANTDVVLDLDNIENDDELTVFPNPFEQMVTVKTDANNPKEHTFKIYDSSGKVYQSGTINATNSSMNLGQLTQGIYFLEINRNGRKMVRQIVKAN